MEWAVNLGFITQKRSSTSELLSSNPTKHPRLDSSMDPNTTHIATNREKSFAKISRDSNTVAGPSDNIANLGEDMRVLESHEGNLDNENILPVESTGSPSHKRSALYIHSTSAISSMESNSSKDSQPLLEGLKQDVIHTKHLLAQKTRQLSDVQRQNDELQNRVQIYQERVHSQDAIKVLLQRDLEAASEESKGSEIRCDALKAELESQETEVRSLKAALLEKEGECETMRNNLNIRGPLSSRL
ncbi:hypothetical protein F5876DRAFT_82798 [Lentinula aff. lateritia]|uniref:Uncharacterized protein n=1 Tax=Lentinula aff. lateritia TaxID=2804960 RepID=A0ACC1TIQ6_9AGAR|nr:hypothetical protein F5876DRAFT_82798 [Lentinula aff. lateritia]